MSEREPTESIVRALRGRRAERTDVEVKAAAGGTPKDVRETLSAFSNDHGGTILLGLVEGRAFRPAPGFDPTAVRDAVAGMAADSMTPPVRAAIEIEAFEGARIVRVDVEEFDTADKPCYITDAGTYGGSYTRAGDGDRRLSNYEVTLLLANHRQPQDDARPVSHARPADLDGAAVSELLARVRARTPRAFEGTDDEDALRKLRVLTLDDRGVLVPTLAGLLSLGIYPQQFFPQLFISFVALPGEHMGDALADGTRFLDNETCDGPIPSMVQTAVKAVVRNMTRASVIQGVGRHDRTEYPVDVVRELIVNAVMHRDYSPSAHGTQVQVELYPNRLVVRSPGGLYGTIDAAQLGAPDVTSSRNPVLARLLSDVTLPGSNHVVCENRGSGIPAVMSSLKRAGMAPPAFGITITRTEVTVPHHALLDPGTTAWIAGLGEIGLTDAQVLSLAMMRSGTTVSNQTLQGWGVHRADATSALADLVARGLAIRRGGRRYATYQLCATTTSTPSQGVLDLEEAAASGSGDAASPPGRTLRDTLRPVLQLMAGGAPVRMQEIRASLDLSFPQARSRVNQLIDAGLVQATAPPTSRRRAYVITSLGRSTLDALAVPPGTAIGPA